MLSVHRVVVASRRVLVRRPWIYWLVALSLAVGVGTSVAGRLARVEAERASWGGRRTVLVARIAIRPGDPIDTAVAPRSLPLAVLPAEPLVPDRPADHEGSVARRHVGVGEILTQGDLAAGTAPLALIPEGWLAVPVVESPPSGARVGDRVLVVTDGFVASGNALVVGHIDGTTLVAVPAHEGAALPAASQNGAVTLLLMP